MSALIGAFAGVIVHFHACRTAPGGVLAGTLTEADGLVVTASHVIDACESPVEASYFGDVAVLAAPSVCAHRDAAPGEAVKVHGFPLSRPDGSEITHIDEIERETRDGVVTVLDGDVGEVRASRLRVGFSGGAVVAKADGRLVGVMVAAEESGVHGYFAPISAICRVINNRSGQ